MNEWHYHTLLELPGVGKATHCQITVDHQPTPLRFIWHHILPQAAGGKSVVDNLAQLCDNCHYATHALLYELKTTGTITPNPANDLEREALARQGYEAAVAAGTVDHIPDEGSAIA